MGTYTLPSVPPGLYTVLVEAQGFEPYENRSVIIGKDLAMQLNIGLKLAPVVQQIVVFSGDPPLSIEPVNTANATRLQGLGLAGLPDDPNDFAAAIQALAGPSALGPTDPYVYLNGFLHGHMPPKEAVRDIEINKDPFSAENDRPAADRIEVTTKSGGRQYHGEGYSNIEVGKWNARNPFSAPLPANGSRLYGANFGGPATGHAALFTSYERTELDFRNAVRATVLDDALNSASVSRNLPDRETRFHWNSQLDLTLGKANTLNLRYANARYTLPNEGVGKTVLPEAGYRITQNRRSVQITETMVLGPKAVSEAKFQFQRTSLSSAATKQAAGIEVASAFTIGGPSSALSSKLQNEWETQENLSNVFGAHTLRAGLPVHAMLSRESIEKNSFGRFAFASGSGPLLGPDNAPVLDALAD